MAVTRHTQKDIGNYEAKLIGPLTAKETMTIAPGIILAVLTGVVMGSMEIFDTMTIFIVCALLVVPFAVFAKAKPYGMQPKDFLQMYYKYHILAPKKRLYKTETFDDVVYKTLGNISDIKTVEEEPSTKNNKKDKAKTQSKKQDPEFRSYL